MEENNILGDIVTYRTYAKYIPHLQRRESWEEIVNRRLMMDLEKFGRLGKGLSNDIINAYNLVHNKEIVPSMRSLQYSGEAIRKNNCKLFNCCYLPIDSMEAFSEILFLLLSGCGVGYSVQSVHTSKLPVVQKPKEENIFYIHDSIEGWAEALDLLVRAYFLRRIRPIFQYGRIRPKGSDLSSGGKAPGSEPLKSMLEDIEDMLVVAHGRALKPIEVHDIICRISDCVIAGGKRRSALISLFDSNDEEMLTCKHGEWWVNHPYRARANNSAVLNRKTTTKADFVNVFNMCKDSNSGEPGVFWSNNEDWGSNPCFSGDTFIKTSHGLVKIKNLVGKSANVFDGFQWVEIDNFRVTGENKNVLSIELYDGSILEVTPNHTMVKDCGAKVPASELRVGDKLMSEESESHGNLSVKGAYLKGFLLGDGTSNKYNTPILYLYDTKFMCKDRLKKSCLELESNGGYKNLSIEEPSFTKKNTDRQTRDSMQGLSCRKEHLYKWVSEYRDGLPDDIFLWDRKSKIDFIAGFFDADGCASDTKNGFMYQVTSINKKLLIDFQLLLKTFGVRSTLRLSKIATRKSMPGGVYDCKDTYRLTISQISSKKLSNIVSFERLKSFKDKEIVNRHISRFNKIKNIREGGIHKKVYCCTVNTNNTISLGIGVRTGQCGEVALRPKEFCNLVSINQTSISGKRDFLKRVYYATIIATLQASYTEFPFLREGWRKTTEDGSLIGISFTGIADTTKIKDSWLREGAELVKKTNRKYAKKIGINPAHRCTTIKPEGSTSAVFGSSSGIHSRFAPFYKRRIRLNQDDVLAKYLQYTVPELIEDDLSAPNTVVLTLSQKSPDNAILMKHERAIDLFDRICKYNKEWVYNGHQVGDNKNNVSATIFVRDNEWADLMRVMWDRKEEYAGISLFPYDGGTYKQAPFEECTEEEFKKIQEISSRIRISDIREEEDYTKLSETISCQGGACEVL